jgi:N-acetyl-gamma-glutamyl-phosphate reductase
VKKVSIGILGATSYTGIELVRRLHSHPHADIAFASSQSYAGQKLSGVFPEVLGMWDGELVSPEQSAKQAGHVDCVFSCLPHAVSAQLCLPFIDKGVKVVDLSADFRIRDAAVYAAWYGAAHPRPALLSQAVFGLVEHYRTQIRTAQIVANPGCYPTSILLPLLPLVKAGVVDTRTIIADSKSGVSGAGRTLKLSSHFVEANENLSAYSVGHAHRHIPEIEQELSGAAGRAVTITFTPHLVPLNRGIFSTIYFAGPPAKQCEEIARAAYGSEPFVRVRASTDLPKIGFVAGTNYCDIAFAGGENGAPVIALCAIDNLLKGASGQAIQNMNVVFGFDETAGLS